MDREPQVVYLPVFIDLRFAGIFPDSFNLGISLVNPFVS
jgi:hypothetical protein